MLTAVARGEITITDYVRLSSAVPARAFGLYPRKGALIPGADADLALVDLKASSRIDRARATPNIQLQRFSSGRTDGPHYQRQPCVWESSAGFSCTGAANSPNEPR